MTAVTQGLRFGERTPMSAGSASAPGNHEEP